MSNNRRLEVGTRIGTIVITGIQSGAEGRHARYNYVCDCGNTDSCRTTMIHRESGRERTCGKCAEFVAGSKSVALALKNAWYAMIGRCYLAEEGDPNYTRYRGRGIRVCKAWYRDKLKFIRWAIENGYEKGLQLDREDNDAGYKPSNCRFVSPKINSRNRHNTTFVEIKGKQVPFAKLVEEKSIVSFSTAYARYYSMNWSLRDALLTPARVGNYR